MESIVPKNNLKKDNEGSSDEEDSEDSDDKIKEASKNSKPFKLGENLSANVSESDLLGNGGIHTH